MDIYDKYKTRKRNGTTSSTTTTTQKKIQRKRKNCRRYFRHETLEMIKLGTNNIPAKKITDLELLMKPTTNNPIKQLNIDNNNNNNNSNNNNNNNNNDNNVIDKNKQELPPICAKVPVICSSKSLPKFNNDHNVDNSGGTGNRTNKNQIQIHSVIKINPTANCQDVQSKKSSTGFMIRDLLEIEVNPPIPPPPPLPPQSKLQPPPLMTLQSNGETIQPIQFPIIRTKPPKILNSLPPQYLPPPMPLYGQRIVRPSVTHYQQYNQKLPFLPGPSTSSSCTIDTTIRSAEEKSQQQQRQQQSGSSCYGRLPRFYERFNEPITSEASMKKSQNKQQQQTHLVKCVLKHKVLNPNSMYFGSCHTRPLDARIPRGKLCYIREKHALLRYYDDNEIRLYLSNINNNNNNDNNNNPTSDKRLLIQLPKEINLNTKSQLTVEEYVKEVELVERYAPCCFCQFYKYVTGYQIVNRKLPVSFLTFLSVYNTNGLEELERRYIKSLKG